MQADFWGFGQYKSSLHFFISLLPRLLCQIEAVGQGKIGQVEPEFRFHQPTARFVPKKPCCIVVQSDGVCAADDFDKFSTDAFLYGTDSIISCGIGQHPAFCNQAVDAGQKSVAADGKGVQAAIDIANGCAGVVRRN